MQIFRTDRSAIVTAHQLDDRRLSKAIVEAAQVVSTAVWKTNCYLAESLYSKGKIYLPSHESHPIVKWTAEKPCNKLYVCDYGWMLCYEFQYRFLKMHKSKSVFRNLRELIFNVYVNEGFKGQPNFTTHHQHVDNVYEAYQKELCHKWRTLDKQEPKWTRREVPNFYIDYLSAFYDA